jgi:hypothetical protein
VRPPSLNAATCSWCSAPATTIDEDGDPQCEICERSQLASGIVRNPTSLDRRPTETRWQYTQRLVRRLSHTRKHGPAAEEFETMEALKRLCGVPG